MSIKEIVAELDREIARLGQARRLLSNAPKIQLDGVITKKSPGRKKRTLSPEARKKIADAQRKRWAAQKAKR